MTESDPHSDAIQAFLNARLADRTDANDFYLWLYSGVSERAFRQLAYLWQAHPDWRDEWKPADQRAYCHTPCALPGGTPTADDGCHWHPVCASCNAVNFGNPDCSGCILHHSGGDETKLADLWAKVDWDRFYRSRQDAAEVTAT